MTTPDETPLGLPEPDWHLMDPVTGDDLAAFARLSDQAVADQLARDREMYDPTAPDFCECPQCEFDEPDADLGYLLYTDPDYLTTRQSSVTAEAVARAHQAVAALSERDATEQQTWGDAARNADVTDSSDEAGS